MEVWHPLSTEWNMDCVSISEPGKERNLIRVLLNRHHKLHSYHTVPFHDGAMLTASDWCLSLSHAEELNHFWTL